MGEDDFYLTEEQYYKLLEEEKSLPREELPRPPKHLSNYKSIIMHHIRRLNKLYSPGHRLKAYEVVT